MHRQRRALSQWHGPVSLRGDRAAFPLLRRAMTAPHEPRRLTHDFHVYPARLPPSLACTILATAAPDDVVLDPFCGSGTTLVEARVRGCRAVGRDVNPLAVRLAKLKTSTWSRPRLSALRCASETAVNRARSILDSRTAAPPPPSARSDFDPHIAWELAALRAAAAEQKEAETLLLCLSSLLVKLSRRAGATSQRSTDKRIPKGRALRQFLDRVDELADMFDTFSRAVPKHSPVADVAEGDARTLDGIPEESVDLVLTSPPYDGQISYAEASDLSRTWLRMGEPGGEIGARGSRNPGAYRRDFVTASKAVRRVLAPRGRLFIVIGGMELDELPVAPGFRIVSSASQARPMGRREHLVLLR